MRTLVTALLFVSLCFPGFAQISAAQTLATESFGAQFPASPTVALPSHPVPPSYADLGPAPANLPAGRVLLFLNRTADQQSRLDALVREQSDPTSPNYRKFLTPSEFGQQFGPSDAALGKLTQWLASNGFVVTRTLKSRLAIEFAATAPQLESAFQTPIHAFASPGSPAARVYANTAAPRIPAEFAALVKGVSLSNFGPRPMNRSLGQFALHPPSDSSATLRTTPLTSTAPDPLYNIPGFQPCAPTGVCYALVPGDYATIYDTKPLLAAGTDGTGVIIGIPSTSNIDIPTVQRFRTLFLPKYSPANLPNVILDGDDPGELTSGTSEAYIDVETAAGVAPNATVNLYTAANSAYTNGLTLALARALEDNIISILSVSYGECEADLGSYNTEFRDFYEEAAAQGITVVAASGDSGSAACDPPPNTTVIGSYQAQFGLAVSGLASTPYNIAVGGTDFLYPANATAADLDKYWAAPSTASLSNNADWSSALSYIPEKVWNNSNPALNQVSTDDFGGGGGGQSSCAFNDGGSPAVCQGGYPKPVWQQGFGNDTVRDIPDVALFAAVGSNYSFYAICAYFPDPAQQQECTIPNAGPNSASAPIVVAGFGGTSVSAPLFAGILALVSQKTQTPRLGLATPTLYPLSKQFPAAFHDIAAGSNAMTCASGSPDCASNGYMTGYAATSGFDLATGLGSVDANQLVSNWAKVTPPAVQSTTTTLSLTPTTGPHQTVITFTVNVTGVSTNPASGTIAIFGGNTTTIQTTNECAAFPCTFSFNGLPGGAYAVVARFLGDGAYASSNSNEVGVTITPEASEVLILNPFSNNQVYPNNGLNGHTDVQIGESLGFVIAFVPATTPASTQFSGLNTPPATGSLSITDKGTSIGQPLLLDTAGSFYFTSSTFSVGAHSLVVHYSGDSSYLPSSSTQPLSTPLNFTVVKAVPGGISIGGLPSYGGVAVGYPLPLNLYVQGVYSASGQMFAEPTGTLSVTVNGIVLPTASLASTSFGDSQATVTIPGNLIVLGNNNIDVAYAGDANYSSATAQATANGIVFQTYSDLGAVPTTTSAGLPITFYPEVERNYQQAVPQTIPTNVSVTMFDGTNPTPFATVPLATDTSRISADAQFSYSGLSVGTHTITMQYAGDSGDLPSSATTTVVITPGIPGFTLSATPVSFASGASSPTAVSTLTVTPSNGLTGTVALTCSAANLPGGSCSIPPSTTISGTAASTVSVSISIGGTTARLASFFLKTGPTAFACLLLGLAFTGTGRRSRIRLLSVLIATTLLLANLTACGSGVTHVSAPAGNYSVVVQASSGAVSASTTIPVTVQ